MSDTTTVPDCFYRVSVKALVLNETRDKFMITQNDNGIWDVPGGGLDWGMQPHAELQRELQEEMGLQASWIAEHPSYFVSGAILKYGPTHGANVWYETTLEHHDFTPSDECIAIDWLGHDNLDQFECYLNVQALLKLFDPTRHRV